MKKLLSLALALIMVLTLSVAVAAEEPPYQHDTSVTIGIAFNGENGTAQTPEETFAYTINDGAMIEGEMVYVTDSSVKNADGVIPMPTWSHTSDTTLTPGEMGSLVYDLPTYEKVGIYYYTIAQNAGQTAGIAYDTRVFVLKVTVIEQNGLVYVAAVHAETASGDKVDENNGFVNTYSAGSLAVTKNVTGNLGDRAKEFNVWVTFTAPEAGVVNSTISYIVDEETKTIAPAEWEENTASVQIALHHEETVTFTNIPYGVTYHVAEDSYEAEDYKTSYNKQDGTIGAASDAVTITNTKGTSVETGLLLNILPYVLLSTVAVMGVVAVTAKKRTSDR